MIRMINQTGDGFADAYSESEAAAYEAKGWAKYVPGNKHVELIATVISNSFPVLSAESVEAPKRRGRPAKVN